MLELVLVALLAATLFHAVRLERALGVLKRDRVQLQELVAGFNASTRQAELGSSGCAPRPTAPACRSPARSTPRCAEGRPALLIERGNRLADRLDGLVRAGRPLASRRRRA